MSSVLLGTAVVAVLGTAAWTDLRSRRIPNLLCAVGWGLGVAVAAGTGPGTLAAVLALSTAVLLVGFLLFARGIFGAGDAKLLAATAAMVGVERFPLALLLIALCGVALALVEAARHRMIVPVLMDCGAVIASWARFGRGPAQLPSHTGLTVPYGVAIAAGGVAAWLL